MKPTHWMMALAVCVAGCQSPAATRSATVVHKGHASPSSAPMASASGPVGVPDPVPEHSRLVDQGVAIDLVGQVKLISDRGWGLISNNGGNLIANNGSGLIANNGGGLVSNNGGGLALPGTKRFATLDAPALPDESLLADAEIQVLDGDGKRLVDAQNRPITATSDHTGHYHLQANLPDENLVLQIRLYNGGQLSALLTRSTAGSGPRSLDVNTASTLGATFVLQQYVQQRKDVYAKLPPAEAVKLQQLLESARGQLDRVPNYQPDELVRATDALQQKTPALHGELETIKLLLLGQSNLGSGLLATQVALSNPRAVHRDAAGNTYIAESVGRIRRVDPQGHITVYAGLGATAASVAGTQPLGLLADMVGQPDGTLFLAENTDHRVRKLLPDGRMVTLAGGGHNDPAAGGKATDAALLNVMRLALAPDGTLYLAQSPDAVTKAGPILAVAPDGSIAALPCWQGNCVDDYTLAIAVAADGTLYALMASPATAGQFGQTLLKYDPAGKAWKTVTSLPVLETEAFMSFGPDGKLYLNVASDDKLLRLDPTAANPTVETVAGQGTATVVDGQSALSGAFPHARGSWHGADGTQLVVCGGDATVREIAPSGLVHVMAGASGLTQVGGVLGLALNSPASVTADASGHLVFSEISGHTIKRLNGDRLELVAGTRSGYAEGPAAAARFNAPAGVAYAGGDLYIFDANNFRLRKLSAGVVTTVAGSGSRGGAVRAKTPALEAAFGKVSAIAVDPQGRVWLADAQNHQVLRLSTDGQIELVAGAPLPADGSPAKPGDSGDGGPASQALLNTPVALAFDAAGTCYLADGGNLRIRKIAPNGTISAYAGSSRTAALPRLITGQADSGNVPAASAVFVVPSALCFDAAGNLYVAELGSAAAKLAGGLSEGGGGLAFELPPMPARMRKIAPDGTVSIVTGPGGKALPDTQGDNALSTPASLAIDGEGRLAIVDTGANQIKILPKGSY